MTPTTAPVLLATAILAALAGCATRAPQPHLAPAKAVAEPARSAPAVVDEATSMPPSPPAPPAPPSAAGFNGAYAPVMMRQALMPVPEANRDNYTHYDDNPVHLAATDPVSTFGIDVDTGSYTNVRHLLNEGQLPPADAVRAEEFINYFDYGYTPPATRDTPFSITTELAPAPWNSQRELLLVGIQGYRVPAMDIPAVNLVFLVDTSGSMDEPDKLPLLKTALKQLVPRLRAKDRVSIVTYAGNAGVVLDSTPGDQHAKIIAAIDAMAAGGSTNGGAGIDLAYAQARQGFIKDGVNRVMLATDGDFNVGTTGVQPLRDRIVEQRKSGVALSTLGFGEGNYNDAMAVALADAGNGSHHYIDSLAEARKVMVDAMAATMMTIAKDVKIQVEFNPAVVSEYRLIGYEKRALAREDFNNDAVDAGEIGAGANVTALYEVTLRDSRGARVDPLRYGHAAPVAGKGNELAFLRLRYKKPGGGPSTLITRPLSASPAPQASERLQFAAAVAAFADALRGGKYLDGYDYAKVAALAHAARGRDDAGYRAAFVQLVRSAGSLGNAQAGADPTTH